MPLNHLRQPLVSFNQLKQRPTPLNHIKKVVLWLIPIRKHSSYKAHSRRQPKIVLPVKMFEQD